MRRRWIAAGIAIVLVGAGLGAIWLAAKESYATKQQRALMNLDTEVVRIELAGQHFNVPMRYLYGEAWEKYKTWPTAKKERTKVDYLHLSVLLPDLRPYYQEDDPKWKVRGHGDRVEVTIKSIKDSERGWHEWLRKRIEEEAAQGQGTIRQGNAYGLIHFHEPVFDKYFPVSGHELYISCDHPKRDSFPSCKTKSNYRPGIVLEYRSALDHLPRWRDIDDGLKAMFDKFSDAALTR